MVNTSNVIKWITYVMMFVSICLIFALMLLTSADVVLRYLFSSPIIGAAEISELLMMAIFYLGLVYTYKKARHISSEIFISRVRPKVKLALALFSSIMLMAMSFACIWGSLESAYVYYQRGEIAWNIPFPVWPFRFLMPLAWLLMFIETMLLFFSQIRNFTVYRDQT